MKAFALDLALRIAFWLNIALTVVYAPAWTPVTVVIAATSWGALAYAHGTRWESRKA